MPRRINAQATTNGRYFKTKKALKEAVANEPEKVFFDGTSPFAPFNGCAARMSDEVILDVVGPDPYNDRRWYATVQLGKDGKAVVR